MMKILLFKGKHLVQTKSVAHGQVSEHAINLHDMSRIRKKLPTVRLPPPCHMDFKTSPSRTLPLISFPSSSNFLRKDLSSDNQMVTLIDDTG